MEDDTIKKQKDDRDYRERAIEKRAKRRGHAVLFSCVLITFFIILLFFLFSKMAHLHSFQPRGKRAMRKKEYLGSRLFVNKETRPKWAENAS